MKEQFCAMLIKQELNIPDDYMAIVKKSKSESFIAKT
jgi:hypothetical protein